ncbi:MAG: GNAT family N-acetyltransferase [Gammaproteobacteria bacterium]
MLTSIRNALSEDTAAIAAGEYQAAEIRGLLNALPHEIPEAAYRDKIKALQESDRGLYVVAEQGSEIVGHVLLDPMPLTANSHICTLTIVVYPAWQGRGIGKQLLTHAIRWAQNNRHIEKIELMVRVGNERAIKLYRSLGFKEEGRIRRRVREADSVYHDDIAMALFVDSGNN